MNDINCYCWLEVKNNEIIYRESYEQGGCSKHFNLEGQLHCTDGPAIIWGDCSNFQVCEYWVNGKFIGKCTTMDRTKMNELEFKVMLYAE